MTTEPKPLDLPPMPEYHDEPAATNQDAEWRHIHDLKKWGRQLAGIAQAQAALADGLAEALLNTTASLAAAISLLERGSKRAAPSDKMFDAMLSDYRKALASARTALAKYRENRHV